MKKLFLSAPQWQDSGRSLELYEGARAACRFFESISDEPILKVPVDTVSVPVMERRIYGYSILAGQLTRIGSALADNTPDKVASIGGGCGIEVPIVSYLYGLYPDLALFWFDAHGDLNSPESSPSGHFHGMPLRFLTERQNDDAVGKAYRVLPTDRVTLIGARDLDPPEIAYIGLHGIPILPSSDDGGELDTVVRRLRGSGCTHACLHIDLDVLDPSSYRNVKCPAPGGMSVERLVESVALLRSGLNVVGMSILENTETDPDRLRLLRDLFSMFLAF